MQFADLVKNIKRRGGNVVCHAQIVQDFMRQLKMQNLLFALLAAIMKLPNKLRQGSKDEKTSHMLAAVGVSR